MTSRMSPVALRRDGRVSPLELLFDLVFVLALTQCTALMAAVPTVEGVAQAMLVLSALWWSWIGYSWLTSVVDPESGLVRLVVFVAMAGFLVAALCVPGAFGDAALVFALAYAVTRIAHIALFVLASRGDPALRSSVVGLAISTALGSGLLLGAAAADDRTQALLWVAALVVDLGGPFLFGAEGWKLVPEHFSERYGLIVIIALGESVVAIGAGVHPGTHGGIGGEVILAAVVATALVVALWWLYFDVVALVAARRLDNASPGRELNEIARDSFSLLHLPMVAGIALIALGLKKTLAHVDGELGTVPAAALLGGTALYLLAHVAFRLRNVHRLSVHRLVVAVLLLGLVPVATLVPAIVAVAGVTVLLCGLVAYETVRFAELRARLLAG
jgi:low temperature requirement protein LtrA